MSFSKQSLSLVLLSLTQSAFAFPKFFVEPGVFLNIYDGSSAQFTNSTDETRGVIRNADMSYAIKIGLHHGHFEYGLETEIYDYEAHLKDDSGDRVEDVKVTYNSAFIGYEFSPKNFIYGSVAFAPYLSSDGKSYLEKHPAFSLEYSRHIKEWVSLNVKMETKADFEVKNSGSNQKIELGEVILIGFSFPLLED